MSKNHLIWGFDSFKRPISFRFFSRNPLEIQIQIISKDPEGGVLIGWSCLEGLKFYSESVIHKKMWGLWNRDAKKKDADHSHTSSPTCWAAVISAFCFLYSDWTASINLSASTLQLAKRTLKQRNGKGRRNSALGHYLIDLIDQFDQFVLPFIFVFPFESNPITM